MDNRVYKQYADLLVEIASEEKQLELVYKSFKEVIGVFEDKELKSLLAHPKIKKEEKKEVISKVIVDVPELLMNFFKVCVDYHRASGMVEIFKCFESKVFQIEGKLEAEVYTATALSDQQIEVISKKLSEYYQKEVIVHNHIDDQLIGGIKVICAGEVLDNTLLSRVQQLENQLKSEV